MGNFWDHFVFRVCIGLGEDHHEGFRRSVPVLEQAYDSSLLSIEELNHLSVLLLLLVCPSESPLGQAAFEEHQRRNLGPEQEWGLLREAIPPTLSHFLLHAHFGEGRQRALVHNQIYSLYVPHLTRFLARTALVDYPVAHLRAMDLIRGALAALDPMNLAENSFLSQLYSRILSLNWPIVNQFRTEVPEWYARLEEPEQALITHSLTLGPGERYAFCLSFDACLNAPQIAQTFQQPGEDWQTEGVVELLTDVWEQLLFLLA